MTAPARHRPDFDTTRAWLAAGAEYFADALGRLDDAALAGPSALPGWSRAHVVSHVASNAGALMNLLSWARTGVETPMYTGPEQRARDIEAGAGQPAATLRERVRDGERALAAAVADLPADRWQATVRTAQGRTVPATEVVWMRVRELWVHADDLHPGEPGRVPVDVVDALLSEALGTIAARNAGFGLTLRDSRTGLSWVAGDPAGAATLTGSTNALVRYVLRGEIAGMAVLDGSGEVPAMPAWI